MSATPNSQDSSAIFEALENYNWEDDVEFQSGLSAILGSNPTPEQATELTLRARCFYYARKYNANVDFDAYKSYRVSRRAQPITSNGIQSPTKAGQEPAGGIMPPPSAASNEQPAPYPTSFAHIVELVTTGQPIPGIKEIPNTILTGQGTQPVKAKRKKPWEKDENEVGERLRQDSVS